VHLTAGRSKRSLRCSTRAYVRRRRATLSSLTRAPSFGRARTRTSRCTGAMRRGAATLQCLECGGITHARRVPYSEQTDSRIRYVPRQRPHDRLRGLNRDPRPASLFFFSLALPRRSFSPSPSRDHLKFLMRDARASRRMRTTSSLSLLHLLYLLRPRTLPYLTLPADTRQ